MTIRTANKNDILALVEVEQAVYGETGFNQYYFRQMLDLYPQLLLVFELEDGRLAGYALGAIGQGPRKGWVLSLAMKPQYQGRGIAKGLSLALLEAFKQVKCETVWLTVSEDNTTAVRLYEKLGFVHHARESDYYGPELDRAVMVLRTSGV